MIEYITKELADKSASARIKDAYQENELSVVVLDDKVWYTENTNDQQLRILVKEEMKRIYPQYQYMLDLGGSK